MGPDVASDIGAPDQARGFTPAIEGKIIAALKSCGMNAQQQMTALEDIINAVKQAETDPLTRPGGVIHEALPKNIKQEIFDAAFSEIGQQVKLAQAPAAAGPAAASPATRPPTPAAKNNSHSPH
jgi:hypothetical protein